MFAALLFAGSMMAADVVKATLDFTDNTAWKLPVGSGAGITTDSAYSDGTYTIRLAATTKYYFHADGYLLFGKSGSTLTLPAFDFDVTKIVVTGRAGASGSTKQNIFVGENAVSTETTGAQVANEYAIASDYQAAGNVYVLKVTSAHNTQVTKIEVYGEGETPSVATPVISGEAEFTESTQVSISCATEGAAIYYTVDGVDPTTNSLPYGDPFTLDQTATVKAVAYANDQYSAVASKTFTKIPSFDSFEALVAAKLADKTLVSVNFADVLIDSIYTSSKGVRQGIYINVMDSTGKKPVEIYYNKDSVPAEWAAGDTLSGTILGNWTYYANGKQWEIVPSTEGWKWENLTRKAASEVQEVQSWKVNAETDTTAGVKYIDNEYLEVKTVYQTAVVAQNAKILYSEFTHAIQVRAAQYPSDTDPIGAKDASKVATPLVLTAKDDAMIGIFYQRQAVNKLCEDNDNKDLKLFDQAAPTTAITAEFLEKAVALADSTYYNVLKIVTLKKDHVYTLTAKGTTIKLFGINYPGEDPEPVFPDTLSCAQAAEAALSGMTDSVKVRGYVTEIAYAWKDGSMSFWMADTLNGGKVFEAYKCAIEKQEDAVSVGDLVVATGKLTKYNTTPELAAGCTVEIIEKIVVPPTDPVLFEGEHAVTWDTPLNLEAAKFAQAKAGQKIVVTYKDATDNIEFKVLDVWCHIAGSREAASLDQAEGSHTYEQFLTANAVDSIKAHGLQIIGNHFTITKVELLDGKELKEGATIWTGFFWADDWKTLEICHESYNYVDFSKYDVLRIYSEANRSDFVINIKENWEEGGQIASQADMVAGEGYMELPLTDTLRTRLANAHHLMFQFNKEAGEPFNVTDIVLANYPAAPTQYEVAEAIAAGLKENDEVLVRGIITKMEFKGKNFAKYGSVNIYVADATGAQGEFEFYNCYSLEADTFRASTPAYDPESTAWAQFSEVVDGNGVAIHVGDTVIARGLYKLFNSTHELNTGCYLVDIKHAPVAPVADTVEVSLSEGLRYDDYVASDGWWQIYGGDDKFVVSISNISTTQAEGTYTVEDLDPKYTYLGVIEGKDTTFVAFVSGSVTLSTNAEAGSVTIEGILIGNDNKAYHLNLVFVAPKPEKTVTLNIPEAALIDYYAAYGLYGVYGTNVEKDHQVYIALWAEDGFQGEFTEADIDMQYIGTGVIDVEGVHEVYTASITVTPGNGGDYNITADLLCYNNTLYKVTMYVPAGQAIDEVDAAQKAVKMIKGGQLIIEKAGKSYNVLGTRL